VGGADLQKKLDELLSGASRSLSAEEAAAGLRNPAYKVVSQKQMSQPHPDRILRIQAGLNKGLSMADAAAQADSSAAWAGGKELAGPPVEFETNMAELDREWLSDAIASGMPNYDDISPAPAPRKSQPSPGDFGMAFDMNDFSPWLQRKRRGY
jgi:hypothetical protein